MNGYSHLVMRGVPMKAVQELLGHGSMAMTIRYSHLSPDVKRDAVEALTEPAPILRATWGQQDLAADEMRSEMSS